MLLAREAPPPFKVDATGESPLDAHFRRLMFDLSPRPKQSNPMNPVVSLRSLRVMIAALLMATHAGGSTVPQVAPRKQRTTPKASLRASVVCTFVLDVTKLAMGSTRVGPSANEYAPSPARSVIGSVFHLTMPNPNTSIF